MLKSAVAALLLSLYTGSAISSDVCLMYSTRYHENRAFVSLDIAGSKNGIIELLVLGSPKHLLVSVNGLDARDTLTDIKEIMCNNKRAGEIRVYDLKQLGMDAGFFEARATGASGSAQGAIPYSIE